MNDAATKKKKYLQELLMDIQVCIQDMVRLLYAEYEAAMKVQETLKGEDDETERR
jgi:hypothetical protein